MRNKSVQECIKQGWMVLLLVIFFTPIQRAFAESYYFDFEGDLHVWDLSGSYNGDFSGGNMSYVLTQDAQGKLTGSGSASYSAYSMDVNMSFGITGSVKQTSGLAIVKMSFKFTGTVSNGLDTIEFTGKATVKVEIDSVAGTMNGIIRLRVSVKGYGSESFEEPYSIELPADMDGTFSLELNVVEENRELLGTGELILSNGDTYHFSITGKYNYRTDKSKFKLTEDVSSKGSKLKIIIDESDGVITSINGKILGQKIKGIYD